MGEIFSAAGAVGAAAISAGAMKDATDAQIAALERQKEFVYDNLDPSVISPQATQADVSQALNRLALQNYVDPVLLQQRYASEAAIAGQAAQVGSPGSASDLVSRAAAGEALMDPSVAGFETAKNRLIDEAMKQLDQGATLPPDVQAELVQTGLEQTGMTTGAASPKGFGGQILRKIIGTAGLQLQQQRQQQAAGLVSQAQNLETSRQNILQNLFPNLSKVQLANLQAQQGVLSQSNQMVPQAGLSGSDIANIWMARVGATNQLAQSAADAAARNGMAQAQVWGNALGGAAGTIGGALPTTQSVFGNWFGPSTQSTGGGGGSNYLEDYVTSDFFL